MPALHTLNCVFLALVANCMPIPALAQAPGTPTESAVLESQTWRSFAAIAERDLETLVSASSLDELCLDLIRHRAERALSTSPADCVREVVSTIDPQSTYIPASERRPPATGPNVGVGSIGLELRRTRAGEPLFIESTIHGAPGERGGLRAGDRIVAVDGASLLPLSVNDSVSRLRGAPGTVATLRVLRGGNEFDLQLVREVIRIQHVRAQSLEGGIAHVRFNVFVKDTVAVQLASAVSRLWGASPFPFASLVLDLRNNSGGDLKEVFAVASLFTEPGTRLLTAAQRSGPESFTSDPRANRPPMPEAVAKFLEQAPLVILVNGKTGSGAEALALVLRRERRAWIIGERTVGSNGVRQMRVLADGSAVQITIGRLTSGGDGGWSVEGVPIDTVVADKGGYEYGRLPADTLLMAAVAMLRAAK